MGDLLPTLSLLCCFCCDKNDPDEERYAFEEGVRNGNRHKQNSEGGRIKSLSAADERRVCEWRAKVPVVASVPGDSTVATAPTTSKATREVMQVSQFEQNRTPDQSHTVDQSRTYIRDQLQTRDRTQSITQDQTRNHYRDPTQHHGRDLDWNDYDYDYDFQFCEQDPTDFDFWSRKQMQRQRRRQEMNDSKEDRRCGERFWSG